MPISASFPPNLPAAAQIGAVNPPATGLRWIERAVKSGTETTLSAQLPAYQTLEPSLRAAAALRGLGKSIAAPQSSADIHGLVPDDPVSLVITGNLAELEAALVSQGWTAVAPRSVVNGV